jgi:uncharacterized protein (DUF1501 family)
MVLPKLWLTEARAQSGEGRRIFVVIQLGGGNDGLNTVVPYTDSRYHSLRPTISFNDTELKDGQGNSTIISNEFGLHPEMSEIKGLFDQGKVAIVRGAGYPNSSLSHFLGQDIWHTANTNGGSGDGWLGKYADQALVGKSGLSAVSIGGTLPKSFFADKVVIPSISNFTTYTYQTDPLNSGDRNNQINTFSANSSRPYPAGSFIEALAGTGLDAVQGAAQVQASVGQYNSPVAYPENNPLAAALRMAAQLITTIPEANLLYVTLGGFDHHSQEIGNQAEPTNKLVGQHATLLRFFSEGVKAFYDDMAAHNLADRVLMMQWSEFGRRPNENASFGTDHGTSAPMFVIGDPVQGGLYGEQPSLAATELDNAGNLKFKVDFRAVYATILDRWLQSDSLSVLGAQFEDVGFLG